MTKTYAEAKRRLLEAQAALLRYEASLPRIVCLCGSTRFRSAFEEASLQETLAGKIVLSVGCFMHHDEVQVTVDQKAALNDLHKRKIDLADEVLILNVGQYIGESTRSELEYAREAGKPVRFWELPAVQGRGVGREF